MAEHPLWLAIKTRNKARRQKVDPLMMKRLEDRVKEEAHKFNEALGEHGHAMMRSLEKARLDEMATVTVRLPKPLLEDLRSMARTEDESGVEELMRSAITESVNRWKRERQKQRRMVQKEKR